MKEVQKRLLIEKKDLIELQATFSWYYSRGT